jgi:hypothetical protein
MHDDLFAEWPPAPKMSPAQTAKRMVLRLGCETTRGRNDALRPKHPAINSAVRRKPNEINGFARHTAIRYNTVLHIRSLSSIGRATDS